MFSFKKNCKPKKKKDQKFINKRIMAFYCKWNKLKITKHKIK